MSSFVVYPEAPLPGEKLPEVENNPLIEKQWAVKAFQHAETYMRLLTSISDHSKIKLTKIDDEIYETFRERFPDFDVRVISEDDIKSDKAKNQWRPFLNQFEKRVFDWNMLTMLRADATGDYTENNTIVGNTLSFVFYSLVNQKQSTKMGNLVSPEVTIIFSFTNNLFFFVVVCLCVLCSASHSIFMF